MATHSTNRVLPTTRIEVARSEKSLLLEIAEGGVPLPPLCTYREWLHWRRTEGKRKGGGQLRKTGSGTGRKPETSR